MTGIIEGVEKMLKNYNTAFTNPVTPPEEKEMLRMSLELLNIADFYEINREITSHVHKLNEELFSDTTNYGIRMPVDARPPSKVCLFYYTNSDFGLLSFWRDAGELPPEPGEEGINYPTVTVFRVSPVHIPTNCGGYIASNKEQENRLLQSRYARTLDENQKNHLDNAIINVGVLSSLINQPRFVIRSETGTRQMRRQMNRGHGIATNAWHKIQWNLNEPVVEKDKGERGGWHLPLHYTRGHWRRGQSHWDDIVIRKDGLPYKWIEGFWSGHPAYGFKKSYHAPNMGEPTNAPPY